MPVYSDLAGTRIALVRHGEYEQRSDAPSALQPFPLTAAGKVHASEGARRLGAALEDLGWRLAPSVHCSVLLRAWQTAQMYCDAINPAAQLIQTEALCERSVGSAANLTITEIERALANDPRADQPPAGWKSNSSYCLPFPGAESLNQAGQRVATFIHEAISSDPSARAGDVLLFVGHGAAMRHGARDLGILNGEDVSSLSMHHGEAILFECDGRQWKRIAGDWKVRGSREAQD